MPRVVGDVQVMIGFGVQNNVRRLSCGRGGIVGQVVVDSVADGARAT